MGPCCRCAVRNARVSHRLGVDAAWGCFSRRWWRARQSRRIVARGGTRYTRAHLRRWRATAYEPWHADTFVWVVGPHSADNKEKQSVASRTRRKKLASCRAPMSSNLRVPRDSRWIVCSSLPPCASHVTTRPKTQPCRPLQILKYHKYNIFNMQNAGIMLRKGELHMQTPPDIGSVLNRKQL